MNLSIVAPRRTSASARADSQVLTSFHHDPLGAPCPRSRWKIRACRQRSPSARARPLGRQRAVGDWPRSARISFGRQEIGESVAGSRGARVSLPKEPPASVPGTLRPSALPAAAAPDRTTGPAASEGQHPASTALRPAPPPPQAARAGRSFALCQGQRRPARITSTSSRPRIQSGAAQELSRDDLLDDPRGHAASPPRSGRPSGRGAVCRTAPAPRNPTSTLSAPPPAPRASGG